MSTTHRFSSQQENYPPGTHKAGWAGLLSVGMHLIILIFGVSMVGGILPRTPRETDRSVSIVLTQATNSSDQRYFSAEEPTSTRTLSHFTPENQQTVVSLNALPADAQAPGSVAALHLPTTGNPYLSLPGLELAGDGLNAAPGRPILEPYGEFAEVLAAEAERARNNTPLGPTTTVSVFGSPAVTGRSFVFVLDRSQSMGEDGLGVLSAAEKELLAAVQKLQSQHRFQIIAYNDKLKYCSQRGLLRANPDSVQGVKEFFQTLTAHGPTDHLAGLMAAVRLQPDVILLLTDGGDPYLGSKQREHIAAASGRTQIHCLQFGWRKPVDETSREGLEMLASERGGTYMFIDMSRRK